MNFTKTSLFAAFAIACGLTAFTGCKDDDKAPAAAGDDTEDNDPASCKAIAEACHHVDTGSGPIHDCHESAHSEAATEESCAAIKANCVSICEAAETDAGEDHDGH